MAEARPTGRIVGSKNYSHENIQYLLYCVRRHLPVGGNDWENVASDYNERFKQDCRDRKSLKRKFVELANRRKPTGSATMPAEVRDAMAIMQDIKGKVATASFGVGGAVDARSLAAAMADEDSAEDDNDDDDRSEEGNDGNAETSERISSQQTSVDQGNAPATQPVPTRPVRTKNSRPSTNSEGGNLPNKRRQISGVLSDLVDNLGSMAASDQQMNRMMMFMMMTCFNQFVEDRRNRDRPRRHSPLRSRQESNQQPSYASVDRSRSANSPALHYRDDESSCLRPGNLFSPYDEDEYDDDYLD